MFPYINKAQRLVILSKTSVDKYSIDKHLTRYSKYIRAWSDKLKFNVVIHQVK